MWRAAGVFGLVLFGSFSAWATPAPSFSVRLSSGRSTYALGERIPLDLEFGGQADDDFYWSTETYDRSGRMGAETYEVTPGDGFEDPLDDYFNGGLFGIPGGGLRGTRALDGSSFRIHVDLNEWVRFTKPGRYELTVSSRRLARYSGQPSPVVSATPVQIVIVRAAEGWAEREVEQAVSALEQGSGGRGKESTQILRHLGTKGAARALVKHYAALDVQASFDLLAALVASPHRALIVEAMEARIDAGDPLPPDFIERVSYLKGLLEMPRGTGDYPTRSARHGALQKEYAARWMAASTKRGWTEAGLGAALSRLNAELGGEAASGIADLLGLHPVEAAKAFLALPSAQQSYLLEHQWPWLDRPWIRPALEALYAGWIGEPGGPAPAGDIALRRIFEVDPGTGRRLVLEEIVTGRRRIGFDALALLADETLPEIDASLRQRFERRLGEARVDYTNRATTAWLMWRYGSSGLLAFVAAALAGPIDACAVRAPLVAYLLKHEPEAGLRQLRPGPGAASAACTFTDLAPRVWDEPVEAAAIQHLAGEDIDEVADIAQILGRHGSAKVRDPLLDRMTRWAAEWRGRSRELDDRRIGIGPGPWPARIENAVTNALFDNPRVALSAEDKARIRELCVTDGCRSNVDVRASMR
jgi:hypothetical protein